MPKGKNQKLKLYFLAWMMIRETDNNHWLTIAQIIDKLEQNGISAERKSLYSDFDALRGFGVEIVHEHKGRTHYYHVGKKLLDFTNLKLYVNAVQSSEDISDAEAKKLAKNLESLASKYEKKELRARINVKNRVKKQKDSIFEAIDIINTAMLGDHDISFHCFRYNAEKNKELVDDGKTYLVSPWDISKISGKYYLIGYSKEKDRLETFSIQRMTDIKEERKKREGKALFEKSGDDAWGLVQVKLLVENSAVDAAIDRFGTDIEIRPKDKKHSYIIFETREDDEFIGKVMSVESAKIISPPKLKKRAAQLAKNFI